MSPLKAPRLYVATMRLRARLGLALRGDLDSITPPALMSPGVMSITNSMAFLDLTNPGGGMDALRRVGDGGGGRGMEPGEPLPFRFHGVFEGQRRGLGNHSGGFRARGDRCIGEGCVPTAEEIVRDKVAAEVQTAADNA